MDIGNVQSMAVMQALKGEQGSNRANQSGGNANPLAQAMQALGPIGDVIAKLVQQMMAGANSGDAGNRLGQSDTAELKNAVGGVNDGRLGQRQREMA